MKTGIYIITNIVDNKSYIGSSKNILQRFGQHKYSLRKGTHYNHHLQSSFNKYGEDNFTFGILELTEDLIERETFHIYSKNVLNPKFGYNKATNIENTSGYTMSVYSRQKMSIAKKGTTMHPNTKKALIKANKERVYDCSYLHTIENIEKCAKAKCKSILQYSLEGVFIQEHFSVLEAADSTSISKRTIANCGAGIRTRAGEYQWFYKPNHGIYPRHVLEYKRRTGNRNYENFMRLCTEMYIEKEGELLENLEVDNQQPS